jgi:hypothetical protein
MRASESSVQPLVRDWMPSTIVYPPAPTQRSANMGSSITPTFGAPSSTNAISVPNVGVPVRKFRVPSIGSMTYIDGPERDMPISSPRMACAG